MKRRAQVAICCGIVAASIVGELSADTPPTTYQLPSNSAVIGYLLQSVNWYRHMYAERQVANEPADFMFLDDNQAIERQIVKLSFEFAKADVVVGTSAASPHGGTTSTDPPPADLAHFIELKKRIDELSQQATEEIKNLDKKLNAASRADRGKLKAAEEDAQTRLHLLDAVTQGLNDLVEFVQNPTEARAQSGHLDSIIDDLAQSIPEMNGESVPSATARLQEANPRIAGSDAGILVLVSNVSAMSRKLHVVDEKMRLSNNLTLSAENLRIPLAAFVTRLIQSVAIIDLQSNDLPSLREQKSHLDAVTLELKGLSPAIVALDKQKVLLAEYKSNVLRLRTDVAGQYRQAWKELMIRLFIVALIIGLLLAIGNVSRRLALRRVQDPNRQRLIGMIHQFLTLLAIAVVILFVLASDLKSVATYLGLLSAGLLLALQNVIPASLGALLLVGKRGIRIGDRVQVSGVTGDVFNMGLLQFQLKEFDVQKQRYTGHVATFSNSLVFLSPAIALLKLNSTLENASKPTANKAGTGADLERRGSPSGTQI
ncbi:MAG: MscS family mechanosensitive ion channel [Candidatus Sulfotelmatobacter sp.]|nr:MscS family mechanosensitive ion channel [Candidatus Sulfotelmatobacter sp.]